MDDQPRRQMIGMLLVRPSETPQPLMVAWPLVEEMKRSREDELGFLDCGQVEHEDIFSTQDSWVKQIWKKSLVDISENLPFPPPSILYLVSVAARAGFIKKWHIQLHRCEVKSYQAVTLNFSSPLFSLHHHPIPACLTNAFQYIFDISCSTHLTDISSMENIKL